VKLRGALIGAGNIALRSHLPQWTSPRLGDAVEIVAVADLARANRDAAQAMLPHARFYDDGHELLDREAIDFVDICTPPSSHRRLIEHAARLRRHVLCEKPLAPGIRDAHAIARAVDAAGITFRPCHQYHHAPQWQAVLARLPQLGTLHFAEYDVLRMSANEGSANWLPSWRTDEAVAGGGILVDHGAHILYQLGEVFGRPRALQATIGRLLHHSYKVEDTALLTLDYCGRLAHVSLTWAARQRAIHYRFVGDRGEISGDDVRLVVHAGSREELEFDRGMSADSSHADWYGPLLSTFVDDLRNGRRDPRPLLEAIEVTEMIVLAYRSARLGRAVLMPAQPPLRTRPIEDAQVVADAAPGATPPATPNAPDDVATTAATPLDLEPARGARHGRLALTLRIAAFALIIGFGAWWLRRLNWPDLWHSLAKADLRWLALAAGVNLVVIAIAARRWLELLRPMSRGARWRDAFSAQVVGLAFSTIVPARGGELARLRWLHRRSDLSQVAILGSIGLDSVLNVAGLVAILGVLPLFGKIPQWMHMAVALTLAVFTLGLILLLLLRPPRRAELAGTTPVVRTPGVLDRIREGLGAMRSPAALGRSLAASLVAWTLEVAVTRFALRACGIVLPLSVSLVVLAGVNLMLAVPIFAPGNFGTLEIGAVLSLLSFGVAREQALAFAVCYHLLQVVPVAAIGFALAGREGIADLRQRAVQRR